MTSLVVAFAAGFAFAWWLRFVKLRSGLLYHRDEGLWVQGKRVTLGPAGVVTKITSKSLTGADGGFAVEYEEDR